MRIYFRSDVTQVSIPQTGHIHGIDDAGKIMQNSEIVHCTDGRDLLTINCPQCEPYLKNAGGSVHITDVPLTTDEKREREMDEEELRLGALPTRASMRRAAANLLDGRH